MRIWIPGANGLLGRALVQKVGEHSLPTGKELDITDIGLLRSFVAANPSITHIVNCAAFSEVDLAESRKDEAFRTNAIGPENLARIAQELGIKLIHISTDYVFPGDGLSPLKETDPVRPLNYYGETKLEGEKRVWAKNPSALILRISGLFGQGGKNFITKLLCMLREKETIQLTCDQWGRFTYAPDLAVALLQMLDASGLYQFANSGPATKFLFGCAMREMCEHLQWSIRAHSLIAVLGKTFPSPCERPPYSVLDTSKIEAVLKTPIRPWQEALREFLCTTVCS